MAQIRILKTKAGQIVIQHAPSGEYDEATLPIPKDEVAEEALTTHEALDAAGVRGASQVDVIDGKVVFDTSKPTFEEAVEARRGAAFARLGALASDADVPEATRAYLLAIVELLGVAPDAPLDPNYRAHP